MRSLAMLALGLTTNRQLVHFSVPPRRSQARPHPPSSFPFTFTSNSPRRVNSTGPACVASTAEGRLPSGRHCRPRRLASPRPPSSSACPGRAVAISRAARLGTEP